MDAERIRRQMQEVAVANYRAFVAADRALSSCREQLTAVGRHLDSMVGYLSVCFCLFFTFYRKLLTFFILLKLFFGYFFEKL